MKISLREHGGFAAATRLGQPAKVLDSTTLDPAAAAELGRLVAAATAAPVAPTAPRPDEMSYAITIENGAPITLRASDTTMNPAFEALLDWLQTRMG